MDPRHVLPQLLRLTRTGFRSFHSTQHAPVSQLSLSVYRLATDTKISGLSLSIGVGVKISTPKMVGVGVGFKFPTPKVGVGVGKTRGVSILPTPTPEHFFLFF